MNTNENMNAIWDFIKEPQREQLRAIEEVTLLGIVEDLRDNLSDASADTVDGAAYIRSLLEALAGRTLERVLPVLAVTPEEAEDRIGQVLVSRWYSTAEFAAMGPGVFGVVVSEDRVSGELKAADWKSEDAAGILSLATGEPAAAE